MRLVMSGGGTGGHIYPALSVARQCLKREPDSQLLYIGSGTGLEKELVAKDGIPFESIEISGFKRKWSLENVRTVVRFAKAVARSRKLLKSFGPDAVIGTGGYVSGPVLYAAVTLGIPTLIHEQNVVPGLANKFLSRYVDCVAVSFKGSEVFFPKSKKVVFTGNPRATDVANANSEKGYEFLGVQKDRKIVVLVGGSRGAKAINDVMIEMAPRLSRLSDAFFVYVTGKEYYDKTLSSIRAQGQYLPPNLKIVPYVYNMPEVLAATHLIVSRSGASSLAEITALGIPSILIPSPNVTNNHQEANARWLEKEGAAEVILENELNAEFLFSRMEAILGDPLRWKSMSYQAKSLGQPEAAVKLLQEIDRLRSNS